MTANSTPVAKTHGKLLTAIFILAIVTLIGSFPDHFSATKMSQAFGPNHDILALYWIFNTIINFIALIGIWIWQKWGVYLLGVAYAVQLVIYPLIFLSGAITAIIGGVVFLAILFGLWYWALSSKWKFFN